MDVDEPTTLLVSYCSESDDVSSIISIGFLCSFKVYLLMLFRLPLFFLPFLLETFPCESECHFGSFSGFDALFNLV